MAPTPSATTAADCPNGPRDRPRGNFSEQPINQLLVHWLPRLGVQYGRRSRCNDLGIGDVGTFALELLRGLGDCTLLPALEDPRGPALGAARLAVEPVGVRVDLGKEF